MWSLALFSLLSQLNMYKICIASINNQSSIRTFLFSFLTTHPKNLGCTVLYVGSINGTLKCLIKQTQLSFWWRVRVSFSISFCICSKTILFIFLPKYILSNIHATQSSANDFRLISSLCRQRVCENAWERKDLEFPSFFEFFQPRFRKSRLPFRINGSGDRWLSPFGRVIPFWCLLWRTKLWESYIHMRYAE